MKNEINDFAILVKEMRKAQKNYFSTRAQGWLNESKKLEKQVDQTVDEIINGQQKMDLQ